MSVLRWYADCKSVGIIQTRKARSNVCGPAVVDFGSVNMAGWL